jgi:acyl-CoA reductase-like NAD-dependent aldehyde dehydrogenase
MRRVLCSKLPASNRYIPKLDLKPAIQSAFSRYQKQDCCDQEKFTQRHFTQSWSRATRSFSTKKMGQGVQIEDGKIVNKNPATGEVISLVPCTPIDQLDAMVENAKAAAPSWSALDSSDRIQLLKKGLEVLSKDIENLQIMIVKEMGKPKAEAEEEAEGCPDKEEYLEILQKALEPKRHGNSIVVRQPLGTSVILSPWNFPADEILYLLLPSLGSGNTVIVKPSEVAPETGAIVVNALASVLPPNVLQLAQGDGAVGSYLVSHPKVDMICMTGSSATGEPR